MLECAGFSSTDRALSSPMHTRAVSTLIAVIAALAAPGANALGFGRVVNGTQLGQPLNFAAVLNLDADETLARECVSAEVFSGDNKLQPGQIRVTLEGGADARERSVRITSTALIDEPVLTVSVTLGCYAKVTRRFVAFIDPPTVNLAQASPNADTTILAPQRADSQLAPLLAIVQAAAPRGSRSAPSAAQGRAAGAAVAGRRAVASPKTGARDAGPAPRRLAARKEERARKPTAPRLAAGPASTPRVAPGGPRLQLETTPTLVARAASAAADPGAVAVPLAAAPAPDEQALALARERQRIVVLEEGLARLRGDSAATNKALAGLQARLKEAEAERYANPLVYGLAWLSGLLMLAAAALWWRQARGRNAVQWWAAPEAARPGASGASNATGAATDPPPSAAQLQDDAAEASTAFGMADVSASVSERSASIPAWASRPPGVALPVPVAAEPARELSVEELIDLEQQAEFFVVLGQDEAAIDLLMSHVRSDGGISPLPYLKLLEIYRRRGENEAYERIRERFNRRFNAYAPDWDSDLQHGRSLEDYPDIIDRLNALWVTPARVMESLDASLFRRNKSDLTFELPAYRELLFLYSIARDLAEHGASEPTADVDLLLPLAEPEAMVQPVSRLLARPGAADDFSSSDMMTMPLDLDVSFGVAPDPYDDGVETAPAALRRVPGQRFGTESGFLDFNPGDAQPGASKPGKTGSSSNR